jgi:MinD superfamily P-loop ATPase
MDRKEFIGKLSGMLIFSSMAIAGFTQVPKQNNKKYTVISKRCDGCGHCFKACRDKALITDDQGKASINAQKCKGCGDCVRYCRRMAIVEAETTPA